jgi:amidase
MTGRRLLVAGLICLGMLAYAGTALADTPTLDLDTLSGTQAEKMMKDGQITSVELTDAYLARIAALNKAGPGLNAITQINPDALQEAAQADYDFAHGIDLGPAMGLPIALKDIIDAAPMFSSAGDFALRNSYAPDSGVAAELKAHGVVIIGKAGLTEWANNFGSQPSGFGNLTGQVLNANDTIAGPSGSSSGSGAAASAGEAALTIGTETSGSIISPSTAEEDVGLRPTVGLVPGYGIAPIDASQDTAGPIVRTVQDAAITLDSIAEYPGSDPTANKEYSDIMGPNYLGSPATGYPNGVNDIPAPSSSLNGHLPDYSTALNLNYVQGKRIGYNSTCTGFAMSGTAPHVTYSCTATETSQQAANDAAVVTLANAGATMVSDPTFAAAAETALPTNWEAHATIDEYYKGIDPQGQTPTNLTNEVQLDGTDPQESEKFGISDHSSQSTSDDSTISNPSNPTPLGVYNQAAYDAILPLRKLALHSAIDTQLQCPGAGVTTNSTETITLPTAIGAPGGGGPTVVDDGSSACPSGTVDPVIAVIGSTSASSPAAGYPEMVVPGGYTTTQRRPIGVDISSGAYDEYDIIGVGYVLQQEQKLQQAPAMIDPASYRCAQTVPAEPFASRGHCNPDYQSIMSMLGDTAPATPSFNLETTSASQLEAMMNAGTLTSAQLVKDELYRMALSNANGPAIQAVRALNPSAIADAQASDAYRAAHGARGPLEGIPVLVNDSIDVQGLATTGGSIALEDNLPAADAALVAKLKAAGAIILGDTNITELNGAFDPNMPQGYSSLGGQVLLPSDTNKSVGGSSAGSAAAVSAGYAPLAVGMESSTNATLAGGGGAQMIAPAANAGLVGLKPTVGLVDMGGVLPDATSQDAAGPMGQTVTDVANALTAMTGGSTNYASGLSTTALNGKQIATVSDNSTTDGYSAAVSELGTLGATTTQVTPGAATSAPSVIPYELHRDLDAYLGNLPASDPDAKSLADVIAYNNANQVEGLKFQQEDLTQGEALDTSSGSSDTTTFQANLAQGQSDDQAVIDNVLNAGPYAAIMVPQSSALVDVADRAGYPVLTVPAAYGAENSSSGGDPIGVDFIGTKDSEAGLLDLAYAYEQATNVRATGPSYMITESNSATFSGAPSETNQSMWRCVPGSAFFSPYDCNAGDLESSTCLDGLQFVCPSTPTTTTTTTTTTTPTTTGTTTTTTTPPPTTPPGTTKKPVGVIKVISLAGGGGFLTARLSCPATDSSCTAAVIRAVIVERISGKVTAIVATAKLSKTVTIALKSLTVKPGASVTVKIALNKTGSKLLKGTAHGLKTRVTVVSSGKTIATRLVKITKVKAAKKK